jgi:Domain of unknown function (DUF4391)
MNTQPVALFAWPLQTKVALPVTKAKIYAHAKPNAALRALFAQQVHSITWAYKLAPETLNLPATPDVPEIDVFELALKRPEAHHAVLRCIDKAIPRPVLFVLRFEARSQAVAAYKRPSDAAAGQWVVGDYHAAAWQDDDVPRPGLPVALNLQGLYEQLVRQHLGAPHRQGESLRDQLDRLALWRAKNVAAAQLETRLAQEKQFNRKVEINAELRTVRHALEALA